MNEIKEKRSLLFLALLAGVVVFSLLLYNTGQRAPEVEPEVVSKRVKIAVPEEPLPVPPLTEQEPSPEPEALVPPAPEPVAAEEPKPAPMEEPAKVVEPEPIKVAKKAPVAMKKPSKPRPAAWAINIASFTLRQGAEDLKTSLRASGYNAYVTEFNKSGVTYHRVRVGFYSTKDEARSVGKTISRTYNMPEPWIVRPSGTEVKKFTR